jgi:hypothetical protein
MPPIPPPAVLRLTRPFLTFTSVVAALCVVAGAGLLVAGLLMPERVSFGSRFAPGLPQEDRVRALMLAAATLMASGALFVAVALQLRKLVDTAIAGDPFIVENGRRLRRIAWLVFLLDFVTRVGKMGVAAVAAPGPAPLSLPVSFTGLLMVMMILVLAHIFEHGSRLRSDVQGTI